MIQLRPHQKTALSAIINSIDSHGYTTGRIVMPTGAGKSFVEAAILEHQRTSNRTNNIHLVLTPRIMLSNQIIEEYRKFPCETQFQAIAFHSGVHEPDYCKIHWKEQATISKDELNQAIQHAKIAGRDLVVFSTYHSCGKLTDIEFDTIIADESQYAVSYTFHQSVKSLIGKVKLFFTATEKYTESDCGRGLNNEDVYGKRLYSISPTELVQLGLIVPPRLHVMYGTSSSEKDSIVDEVIQIGKEQHKITVGELGFSKILFAMTGTKDVKIINDNLEKLKLAFPSHDVFTITGKTGSVINGKKVKSRTVFLDTLKDCTNALIFHYDILSEGIDVDGISGVVLMRNMYLAKLMQTIGRAVRVYKPNPSLKRQAWISVPVINGDEDDRIRVGNTIRTIRDGGYDISIDDALETGAVNHIGQVVNLEDALEKYKNNWSNLFLESVYHRIEEDERWSELSMMADDIFIERFDETQI